MSLGSLYYVDVKVRVTETLSASTSFKNVIGSFGPKAPVLASQFQTSCVSAPAKKLYAYVNTSRNVRLAPLDGLSEGDAFSMAGWYLHV